MRADFGRNAMDGARGIERGAGAFVPVAAETDGTSLAVVLVAVEKVPDVLGDGAAVNLFGSVGNVPHHVGRVGLGRNESRAREEVPVRGAGDNAFGHLAARGAMACAREPELQLVLDGPEVERIFLALEFDPEFRDFGVFARQNVEFIAGPLAIEIYGGRHVRKSLRVEPADGIGKRMHVIAGHDRKHDGIELEQGGNVRLDELEGTGSAHLAAAGVVMRFRTVEREENAELLALEVIDNGIVEQRRVGIDGKAQAEILESIQSSGSPPKNVMFMKRWFSASVRSKANRMAASMISVDIVRLRASWLTL